MCGDKTGCGSHGAWKGHGTKDMSEWKEKYEKMSDSEKKSMLGEKMKHLNKKMDWVKGEQEKLDK